LGKDSASNNKKRGMKTIAFYVYLMATENNRVLYIGVTNDLNRRVLEHREGPHKGFSYKYNVKKLVYFEKFEYIDKAILREKQLKEWRRSWKDELINQTNPQWTDLSLMI
jgi:putative endonuclease